LYSRLLRIEVYYTGNTQYFSLIVCNVEDKQPKRSNAPYE